IKAAEAALVSAVFLVEQADLLFGDGLAVQDDGAATLVTVVDDLREGADFLALFRVLARLLRQVPDGIFTSAGGFRLIDDLEEDASAEVVGADLAGAVRHRRAPEEGEERSGDDGEKNSPQPEHDGALPEFRERQLIAPGRAPPAVPLAQTR